MSDAATRGVVMEGTGGVWRVHLAPGTVVDAALRGRLKQSEDVKLAVGDDVSVEQGDGALWAISEIHSRRSQLARRAPGSRAGERVVVANVDQVVVVFAFVKPEPHARMLDRFLVIAAANHIDAIIVFNKCDLAEASTRHALATPYEQAGYAVHYTSVKADIGLEELHDALVGRTSALSGPSGVGKSSLLNAMYPGANLRVGEISESVNKGRHTTVGAKLIALPDGGFVADTPGLREVGLWGIEGRHLENCFPEFRPFLGGCRFQDCVHDTEPGCAIHAAIAEGAVTRERHGSYLKLRAELDSTPAQY